MPIDVSTDPEPVSIADVVSARVPKDVVMSPDGTRVAFSLGWASKTGEHPVADLWLAAVDGTALRRLTTGESNDVQPRWSPDGATLAFISDRAKRGTGALYLIAVDGGEAACLSRWDAALANPHWSSDGRRISVLATEAESDEEQRRKAERDDPLVYADGWRDEKLDRLRAIDLPHGRLASAAIELVQPGAPLIEGEWQHVWDQVPSPDGRWIAVRLARHTGYGETFRGVRLALIPAEGGAPIWVGGADDAARPWRAAASPVWSPDGARLAFMGAFDRKRDAGTAIYIVDPDAPGSATERHRSERDSGLAVAWPRPDTLVSLRECGVNVNLYAVDPKDGAMTALLSGAVGSSGSIPIDTKATALGLAFDRAGTTVGVVWGAAMQPREVWAGPVGESARQLTHFNATLASRALGRTELIRWAGEGGLEIEGQVIYPVGYAAGRGYPTILHIHGGPTWLWDDHLYADWHDWGQLLAGQGYVVLLPNPRGSTGRGSAFQIANHADWMGADYRDSQAGLDLLIARGIADPERLGIGGWSYGGLTTAWAVTQTNRFKAAIMGAGVSNKASMQGTTDIGPWGASWWAAEFAEDPDAYWQRSAIRYHGQATTPTLILHGGADERVPPSQGWEFYNALRATGVDTQLVIYPRETHDINERHHQRDLLERVLGWFGRFVRGDA